MATLLKDIWLLILGQYCDSHDPYLAIKLTSRVCKSWYQFLSVQSRNQRLSKRGRAFRFFLRLNNFQFRTDFCANPVFPVSYYKDHFDNLNWEWISLNQGILESFLEENLDMLYWDQVCSLTHLSEDFFIRHKHRYCYKGSLSCRELLSNKNLSLEFVVDHVQKHHGDNKFIQDITLNEVIREDFWEATVSKLDKFQWQNLCSNPGISEEFFWKHFDKIDWRTMWTNHGLSEAFIEKLIKHCPPDKINWHHICQHPNISFEFIKRHFDNINWLTIGANINLPIEFFEENVDKIEKIRLSQNESLPESFFEKHHKVMSPYGISQNKSLSPDFFERHPQLISEGMLIGSNDFGFLKL